MFGVVDGVKDGENGTARVADWRKGSAIGTMYDVWILINPQTCFTPCRNIISWNIAPPLSPTKLGDEPVSQ